MKVTPELLQLVAQENRALNQIGDNVKDGLSWEIGEDIGFMHPEQAASLKISPEAAGDAGARAVSQSVEVEPVEHTPTEPAPRRKLTIAEMNANERRHIARTRRLYPKNRRGR